MIISASRRTDIPAFYSKWFMERIKEGYYIKVNPFNSKQKKVVSLNPEDVDCIVFWTKNPKPMMKHLRELDELGYRYYFQYTLNDYPKPLEPRLPHLNSRLEIFRELSDCIGPEKVIWRFDPIIYSSITPIPYLIDKFSFIAKQLNGYTSRVVISFVDMYGKTKNKFKKIENEHGIEFFNLQADSNKREFHKLVSTLSTISRENHLQIFSCAEKVKLDAYGIKHGACIDHQLIRDIFHTDIHVKKDPNQRTECLCSVSEEMGSYDTCKFNCTYCYAVRSEKTVQKNSANHSWNSPLLVGKLEVGEPLYEQLNLFDNK